MRTVLKLVRLLVGNVDSVLVLAVCLVVLVFFALASETEFLAFSMLARETEFFVFSVLARETEFLAQRVARRETRLPRSLASSLE